MNVALLALPRASCDFQWPQWGVIKAVQLARIGTQVEIRNATVRCDAEDHSISKGLAASLEQEAVKSHKGLQKQSACNPKTIRHRSAGTPLTL